MYIWSAVLDGVAYEYGGRIGDIDCGVCIEPQTAESIAESFCRSGVRKNFQACKHFTYHSQNRTSLTKNAPPQINNIPQITFTAFTAQ